eukprot:6022697-Prymnesium_polylepis.1
MALANRMRRARNGETFIGTHDKTGVRVRRAKHGLCLGYALPSEAGEEKAPQWCRRSRGGGQ